jgi:hypothetical protein
VTTLRLPIRASEPEAGDALACLAAVAPAGPAERRALLRDALAAGRRAPREVVLRVAAGLFSDDDLVALLREDADDVLRNAGVEMLVMRGAAALPLLAGLLADRDHDVALMAVMALDRIRHPGALETLCLALRHPNPNVVQGALAALGHLGHPGAVPFLVPFCAADLWLRAAAVDALGDLRCAAAVEPLTRLLDDAFVGTLAAEAVARIGGARSFAALARRWLAESGDGEPMLALLVSVAEAHDDALPPVSGLREALHMTLRWHALEAQVAAARCLLAMGPGPDDGEALDVLVRAGTPATPLPACVSRRSDLIGVLLAAGGVRRGWGLLLAAHHPHAVSVGALEQVIAETVHTEEVAALAALLEALADPLLAAATLRLFARLTPRERRPLLPVVRSSRDALRSALAGERNVPDAARRLLDAALADDAAHRIVALTDAERLEALELVADRADVVAELPWIAWLEADATTYAPLAVRFAEHTGLEHSLADVRDLLARAPHPDLVRLLGRLRDPASVPALIALAWDGNPELGPFVLDALGAIGGDGARAALRAVAAGGGAWARYAYRALAACRSDADLDLFRRGAAHPDWHVRLVCVGVIATARRPEDLPLLAQASADPARAVADRARSGLTC